MYEKCQGLRGGAPHKMSLCVAYKAYLAIDLRGKMGSVGSVGPVGSLWLKYSSDKGDRVVPQVVPEK